MEFDDYNYQALNRQILKVKPKAQESDDEQQEQYPEGYQQEKSKQDEFKVPQQIAQIQQRSRVGQIQQVKQLTAQDEQYGTKTDESQFTQQELSKFKDQYQGKRNSTDVILSKQNRDLFQDLVNMRDSMMMDKKQEDKSLININKFFNKQKSKAQQPGTSSAQNALFRQFGIMLDSQRQNSRPKLLRMNSPNWKLKQQLKRKSEQQNSPGGSGTGLVLRPIPMHEQKQGSYENSFKTESFESNRQQIKNQDESDQEADNGDNFAGKVQQLKMSEVTPQERSKHKKRELNDSSIPLQQDMREISSFNPSKRGKGKKKKR